MSKKTIYLIILSIVATASLCVTIFIINGLYQNDKLFKAIENNDYAAAEKAIERGAWINTRDDIYAGCINYFWNPTPLIKACNMGNYDIVKLLVENGADVNKRDNVLFSTPLIATLNFHSNANRYKIAKYLVDNGADINANNKKFSVLSEALTVFDSDSEQTKEESLEFIQYLIEKGVDTNLQVGANGNLLTCAAARGNLLVVNYLLDNKIYDINSKDVMGETALIATAKANREYKMEMIKLLLMRGADKQIKNTAGYTAYDEALTCYEKMQNNPYYTEEQKEYERIIISLLE